MQHAPSGTPDSGWPLNAKKIQVSPLPFGAKPCTACTCGCRPQKSNSCKHRAKRQVHKPRRALHRDLSIQSVADGRRSVVGAALELDHSGCCDGHGLGRHERDDVGPVAVGLPAHLERVLSVQHHAGPHGEAREAARGAPGRAGHAEGQAPLLLARAAAGLRVVEVLEELGRCQELEGCLLGRADAQGRRGSGLGAAPAPQALAGREQPGPRAAAPVEHRRDAGLAARGDHALLAPALLEEAPPGIPHSGLHALLRRNAADELRHDKVHALWQHHLRGVTLNDLDLRS
mmetsp:Transcript_28087/g.89287  ORF Transcript_28087/g.89287 Transcript_28087/m.89287 type:complete len:288 (-) Transcript_28087:874-1737(-)